MGRFLGTNVWKVIRSEAAASGKKRLAVAFVYNVDSLHLRMGDTLITDASERAITTGQTNAKLLYKLIKRGVQVYSKTSLHAKVYILPKSLIVASANLSAKSPSLVEAGVIERSAGARRDANRWFEQTIANSQPLTESTASRLAQISVVRRGSASLSPTLLEALERGHPILGDFVFSYCFTDAEVPERVARDTGHTSGLIVPGSSQNHWTWSEWEEEAGLKAKLDATYTGRPGICFFVRPSNDRTSFVFTGVYGYATNFGGSSRVQYRKRYYRLAYDLIQKGIPGLTTNGRPWRRTLIQRMNAGILREPKVAQRILARTSAEIKLPELLAIVAVGGR